MHHQREFCLRSHRVFSSRGYTASKAALEALSEALAQEIKPFNVRVALIEPGIIDTAMARRIEKPLVESLYAQCRRFAGMFQASLVTPRPPSLVAERIRDVIESGTWQLRHPVGPDAQPFLGWRSSMTDEEWVEWGALNDEVVSACSERFRLGCTFYGTAPVCGHASLSHGLSLGVPKSPPPTVSLDITLLNPN